MATQEGIQFIPGLGLSRGLPCAGVISPEQQLGGEVEFDVIVIGAGYAGLVAARELSTKGHRILLVEARDRIGGRTWTSIIGGYPYEMGGTWVHWNQGHVWAELSRYNMLHMLEDSQDTTQEYNYHTWRLHGEIRNISYDEERIVRERAIRTFMNIDGVYGRSVLPNPYIGSAYSKTTAFESLSAADRIGQIQSQLSVEEVQILSSFLTQNSGAALEETSFLDLFRWWALSGHNLEAEEESVMKWKLKCGQTGLHQRMFQEALSTGNLSYIFSCSVTSINQATDTASVFLSNGRNYNARRIVCTLPLNTLNDISWSPTLPAAKQMAASGGHVNKCFKTHFEVAGKKHRSWSGTGWPYGIAGVFGDGMTPEGNTHLVSFSANNSYSVEAEKAVMEMANSLQTFDNSLHIQRIIYHDWEADPYAKGTWCMMRAGFSKSHLIALQEPFGRVAFVSADWADGWRGFIDGAIEQALRQSHTINERLYEEKSTKMLGIQPKM